MQDTILLESLFKRDRYIVGAGLFFVAAIGWGYLLFLAWDMRLGGVGGGMSMSRVNPWSPVDFALMYVMWAVMMVSMMVPTAAPMILTFVNINRRRMETKRPYVSTSVFLMGYLIIWFGFATLATLSQWALHQAALLSSMMGSVGPIVGGSLLVVAGVFQWTPFKNICLNHCRTPIGFMMTEWREGTRGALVMGVRHGGFCLGCCWFLMALMFAAGIMNIVWMAGIAAYMLVEKVVPAGPWGSRLTWTAGGAMVVWGSWIVLNALTLL